MLVVLGLMTVLAAPETIEYTAVAVEPAKEVELHEALKPVCACESTGSKDREPVHDINGVVIRGKINPDDIGICQINLKYHAAAAEQQGLDLFDRDDNIRYANWLYEREGLTPWNWSRHCWD